MANIPASGPSARSQHATLTANVVDVVTLDRAYSYVEVINSDTTNAIYFTVNKGASDERVLTPTVGGAGTYYVGPGAVREVHDDSPSQYLTTTPVTAVQLISAGAAAYHVTGFQESGG